MTTIFCDGNYIVADKLATCVRLVNNRHTEGSSSATSYRFGVTDSVKIAKIKGVCVDDKRVKAVATAGSATDAGDFLRDLRDYVKIGTNAQNPTIDLQTFLKVRGVFKVPFTGNFSIMFLMEDKQALILKVSASSKKVRNGDGASYSTEMIRFKKHDFSKAGTDLIGMGSGFNYYSELGPFLKREAEHPHILDAYCYCVNRDHEHSSNSFSVYSLELDHLDDTVDFEPGDFERRLKRFTDRLDFSPRVYGSLPVAHRVSDN